jgi:hypothetical protein
MTIRRHKAVFVLLLIVLAVAYLSGPIIAGIFDIGNRAGPKIYAQGFHEAVYIIAWESGSEELQGDECRMKTENEARP